MTKSIVAGGGRPNGNGNATGRGRRGPSRTCITEGGKLVESGKQGNADNAAKKSKPMAREEAMRHT